MRGFAALLTMRTVLTTWAEGCLTQSERVVGAWLYILKCADGSFYTGRTRSDLEKRIGEHQSGMLGGYTAKRRPVMLAFAQHFDLITDAIAAERQIKGWSRVKKEALIAGDFAELRAAAKRKGSFSKRLVGAEPDRLGLIGYAVSRASDF